MEQIYSSAMLFKTGEGVEPKPDIPSVWLYKNRINETEKNVRTLYYYNNASGSTDVTVPYGYTELQDYQNVTSPYNNTEFTLPFFYHSTLNSINLKNVPFRNNSMNFAFWRCTNLTFVTNINKNITNMYNTFAYCSKFNQNIQIPNSVTNMTHTFLGCSNLNQNIQIPNSVTSMSGTFNGCSNLNQNIQIPNSVTSIAGTFWGCSKFNQNIQIPNSVTSMSITFNSCSNLNQNIQIPNSVTSMSGTFNGCSKLNQNIRIPNSVTSMSYTFASCSNLNQNIQIPNSVTSVDDIFNGCSNLNQSIQIGTGVSRLDWSFRNCTNLNKRINILSENIYSMAGTFYDCISFDQNIQIPANVSNLSYTFYNCTSLSNTITIPDKVTSMYKTFYCCYKLKIASISATNITNITEAFYQAGSNNNAVYTITLYFPMRYINNVNSATRNSLVSAGYPIGNGLGIYANNSTQNVNIRAWDIIPYESGCNTYTGNGTHWILTKWAGLGRAGANSTLPATSQNYPTAFSNACFQGNTTLSGIRCNKVPISGTSAVNAFRECANLTYANWINIPSGITTVWGVFANCKKLTLASSGSGTTGVGDVQIPNTVTNAQSLYQNCSGLHTLYMNSYNVTQMAYFAEYINKGALNVYIRSPKVTNITNWQGGHNSSFRKNVYIYFNYANGVRTATFNQFKATLYSGTSGNGASVTQMYNSKSNFYIYNLGVCPI